MPCVFRFLWKNESLHLGIQGDVGYGQPRARYPNSLTGVYPFVPVAKFKPFYQFLLGQKNVSLGVSHFIMFSFKVSVLSLRFPAIGYFFCPECTQNLTMMMAFSRGCCWTTGTQPWKQPSVHGNCGCILWLRKVQEFKSVQLIIQITSFRPTKIAGISTFHRFFPEKKGRKYRDVSWWVLVPSHFGQGQDFWPPTNFPSQNWWWQGQASGGRCGPLPFAIVVWVKFPIQNVGEREAHWHLSCTLRESQWFPFL